MSGRMRNEAPLQTHRIGYDGRSSASFDYYYIYISKKNSLSNYYIYIINKFNHIRKE